MPLAQTIIKLRKQMLIAALQAREDRIDDNSAAFSTGKAEVESILDNLIKIYQEDPTLFEDSLLAEIRTARVCVGLISRADLEQLESEPKQKAVTVAHKAFLKKHRIAHKGTRRGLSSRKEVICYACQKATDHSIDLECVICNWVICSCGACGCGVAKSS